MDPNNLNTTPFYTWESYQGSLYFYEDSDNFRLCYEDIEIQRENVRGISYTILAENIQEFSKNHFFKLTKGNDKHFIDFFECINLDEYEINPSGKNIGTVGFVANKLEKKVKISFDKKSPDYRIVSFGLNLEGECINKVCLAYQKNVIIPKGIGFFDIGEELLEFACPLCKIEIPVDKFKNIGFAGCIVEIKGGKSLPDGRVRVQQKYEVEDGCYTTFQSEDKCVWTSLKITTTEKQKNTEINWGCSIL